MSIMPNQGDVVDKAKGPSDLDRLAADTAMKKRTKSLVMVQMTIGTRVMTLRARAHLPQRAKREVEARRVSSPAGIQFG
jgi:hypothetical protein